MLFVPDAVFDTAPGTESFFYAVVLLLTPGRGQNETTGKDGYSMKTALEAIEKKAFDELERADGLKALDAVRVKYLGKKGELTAILKQMGKLSAEERPAIGQLANQVRAQIEEKLEESKAHLESKALDLRLATETLDGLHPTHPNDKHGPVQRCELEASGSP